MTNLDSRRPFVGHGKKPRSGNAGKKPNKKPARTEQNDKCVLVMSESECDYAEVESLESQRWLAPSGHA